MSHNLTEADTYPATVTVPDGTDSRNQAAEDVEAIAQVLANRTNNLNLHAAKKNAANVFTVAPQTVTQNDASQAALVVDTGAADDANPANLWKNELGFLVSDTGGGYNNLYAGVRTGPGQWIHAINAFWDVANQRWQADNSSYDSFAIIYDIANGVTVSRRPAGAGTWTSWPTTSGNITVGGNLIVTTGNFEYAAPVARSVALRLSAGKGIAPELSTNEYVPTNFGVDVIMVPLPPVPAGASLTGVDCSAHQNTTSPNSFKLWKRHVNYSTPAAPTFTQVGSTATHASSSGYPATVSIDPGGLTVINVADEYYVEWLPADAGDKLVGIRVNFDDPGPRNY